MVTTREKFNRVMRHGDLTEGFPVIEVGSYWDLTWKRWVSEGIEDVLKGKTVAQHFNLDTRSGYWKSAITGEAHQAANKPADWRWEQPIIHSEKDYDRIHPHLFPADLSDGEKAAMEQMARQQEVGEVWITYAFDGPFWFPRMLLGVEPHFYALLEQPRYMRRMVDELTEFNLAILDRVCEIFTPDVVCFAEDMCYRGGSMISRDLFDQYMSPHYRSLLPEIRKRGILSMVDSDGQVEPIVPWFHEVGLDGMSPLERQAGVDVNRIRHHYPKFVMTGGYDKMVMDKGEAAMQAEFDRLMPVALSGYYIPTEDHQVPPAVGFHDYGIYTRLLREFSDEVAREARANKRGEGEGIGL